MADDCDRADIYIEQEIKAGLSRIQVNEESKFGECDDCGEEGRLINGICVPCAKLQEDRNRRWKL